MATSLQPPVPIRAINIDGFRRDVYGLQSDGGELDHERDQPIGAAREIEGAQRATPPPSPPGTRHCAKKRVISFTWISASPYPCVTSKIVLIGRWHQSPVYSFHDLKAFLAKPLGHLLIVMSVGIKRSEAIASCV